MTAPSPICIWIGEDAVGFGCSIVPLLASSSSLPAEIDPACAGTATPASRALEKPVHSRTSSRPDWAATPASSTESTNSQQNRRISKIGLSLFFAPRYRAVPGKETLLQPRSDGNMQRYWTALAIPAMLVGLWTPISAKAAELPAPACGSFWSLHSGVDAQQRSALVDQAVGNVDHQDAFAAQTLAQYISKDGTLSGRHQEYFVNPEPSSVLVWATSAMGLLAAGYGYRRRSHE
jgi:hypothetical protein